MRLPFGRRTAELETRNRILTDAARKRAERIEEFEHRVAQLEHQVVYLKTQLESARKRVTELEVLDAQRAHLLNEKDKGIAGAREVLTHRGNEKDEELAGLREVLTQRAHLLNQKDEELAGLREVLTQRARSLNKNIEALGSVREFLTQWARSLNEDEGIAGAREALTKCSLRIRELEDALLEIYKK